MDFKNDKKSDIEYKIDDLRERIDLLEDMEEKRVLLFSAFGAVSILTSSVTCLLYFSWTLLN